MEVLLARIGKALGLRGEVTVQVSTDSPHERFVVGAVCTTDPAAAGPLTLVSARRHQGRWLLGFEGVRDRAAAEALRGIRLLGHVEEAEEEDAWYEADLRGLRVEDPDGRVLGVVAGLQPRSAQDLLVVALDDGHEALVPFVEAIVPVVDVEGGRLVLDGPPGLLDLGRSAGPERPARSGSPRRPEAPQGAGRESDPGSESR